MPDSTRHILVIGISIWVKQYPFSVAEMGHVHPKNCMCWLALLCSILSWFLVVFELVSPLTLFKINWHWKSHAPTCSTILILWTCQVFLAKKKKEAITRFSTPNSIYPSHIRHKLRIFLVCIKHFISFVECRKLRIISKKAANRISKHT